MSETCNHLTSFLRDHRTISTKDAIPGHVMNNFQTSLSLLSDAMTMWWILSTEKNGLSWNKL